MNEALYNERLRRIETAAKLGQPDRVPNITLIGAFPYHEYGVTMAESMVDFDKATEALVRFYREFPQIDAGAGLGFTLSAKLLEHSGIKCLRWPGDPKGLDVNNTFQYIEYPTMEEDEYDEYFDNAEKFVIQKYLPRVFSIFEPFAKIDFSSLPGGHYLDGIAAFTTPELIETYKALIACAEEQQRFLVASAQSDQLVRELGFPSVMGGGSATAFDMIGDTLRCTFGFMPDLVERPDKVTRLLQIFVKKHIEHSIGFSRMLGSQYAWVMLHKGFDNFISDEMYKTFYWPYLQEWILAMIDADLTPVVYTEGSYTTRLPYLADVPKGKVIYHFEEVDLAAAKKTLGGTAAIMGAFPMFTLTNGTKQQVADKVKETIDVLAPGGGYLFATGSSVEQCSRENLETMFETVEQYGKY